MVMLSLALFRSAFQYGLVTCCLLALLAGAQSDPQAQSPTASEVVQALRAKDFAKGLQLAREHAKSQPEDPRAWTLVGLALSGLGRNAESLSALQKALKLRPDFLPALEAAAQLEYNRRRPDAAAFLERVLRLNPQEPTAHAMLGSLAFRRKDCDPAVSHFKQSWPVINSRPEALTEYGDCLVRIARLIDAIPVFNRLIYLQPDDWQPRYDLAVIQFRVRHSEEAIQTLQPLVERPKPIPEALNLIAAAYEATQQTPMAVAALEQAIKLAPRDPTNYLDLATISLDHGSFQVGVDVLSAAIRVMPDSAPLHLERGVLLAQMAKYDQATADFEEASTLSPQQNMGAVAQGISLLERNHPDQCLQLIRDHLHKSPDDPILNYLLAEALLRKGVQPGMPEFREAESAARRSVQSKPEFALGHDVLSQLYLRAGMTTEAIQQSRLALEVDPQDQSGLYNLIMGLRKSGRTSEVPALVRRLAQVNTSAREREANISRFKLVEKPVGVDQGNNMTSDQPSDSTAH
jgi:tetratricopeptide (TPR) repeat protein